MRLVRAHRRLLTEGTWVFAGHLLSALGALIGLRLLTHLLPPEVFGEVVLVSGIVLLANGLAAGPLMQGLLRYYPEAVARGETGELRRSVNYYLTRSTVLTSVGCILGLAVYGLLAPVNPWFGCLVVLLLILDVVRQRELTYMSAARHQRATALWTAADVWARPVLAIGMISLVGPNAVATLAGYCGASFLLIMVFRRWFVRDGRLDPDSHIHKHILNQDRKVAPDLWKYSLPLMPLGVIGWMAGQADRFVIGGVIGLQEAGLYAAMYGIVSRPFLMASGAVESWLRPVYYEAVVNREREREHRIFRAWGMAMGGVGLMGFALFAIWHRDIASLLLAPAYRSVSWLMPWIALGYGLLLMAQVYERVCYAHHDTRAVFITETVGGVLALAATSFAVYQFELPGAAYAVPVSFGGQLIAALISARRVQRRIRFKADNIQQARSEQFQFEGSVETRKIA